MARQSKRQNRRALSGFLLLLIIGSVTVGVVKLDTTKSCPVSNS